MRKKSLLLLLTLAMMVASFASLSFAGAEATNVTINYVSNVEVYANEFDRSTFSFSADLSSATQNADGDTKITDNVLINGVSLTAIKTAAEADEKDAFDLFLGDGPFGGDGLTHKQFSLRDKRVAGHELFKYDGNDSIVFKTAIEFPSGATVAEDITYNLSWDSAIGYGSWKSADATNVTISEVRNSGGTIEVHFNGITLPSNAEALHTKRLVVDFISIDGYAFNNYGATTAAHDDENRGSDIRLNQTAPNRFDIAQYYAGTPVPRGWPAGTRVKIYKGVGFLNFDSGDALMGNKKLDKNYEFVLSDGGAWESVEWTNVEGALTNTALSTIVAAEESASATHKTFTMTFSNKVIQADFDRIKDTIKLNGKTLAEINSETPVIMTKTEYAIKLTIANKWFAADVEAGEIKDNDKLEILNTFSIDGVKKILSGVTKYFNYVSNKWHDDDVSIKEVHGKHVSFDQAIADARVENKLVSVTSEDGGMQATITLKFEKPITDARAIHMARASMAELFSLNTESAANDVLAYGTLDSIWDLIEIDGKTVKEIMEAYSEATNAVDVHLEMGSDKFDNIRIVVLQKTEEGADAPSKIDFSKDFEITVKEGFLSKTSKFSSDQSIEYNAEYEIWLAEGEVIPTFGKVMLKSLSAPQFDGTSSQNVKISLTFDKNITASEFQHFDAGRTMIRALGIPGYLDSDFDMFDKFAMVSKARDKMYINGKNYKEIYALEPDGSQHTGVVAMHVGQGGNAKLTMVIGGTYQKTGTDGVIQTLDRPYRITDLNQNFVITIKAGIIFPGLVSTQEDQSFVWDPITAKWYVGSSASDIPTTEDPDNDVGDVGGIDDSGKSGCGSVIDTSNGTVIILFTIVAAVLFVAVRKMKKTTAEGNDADNAFSTVNSKKEK